MTPLPVLIDVTAVPEDRRGVGRYVDELVRALDGDLIIACQARDEGHYRAIAPRARLLPQHGIERVWVRLLWEQFTLPAVALRAGARVIHSPHYTLPLLSRLARVVTLHDATFFSDPGVHTRLKRLFFRTWIRASTRLANALVVPSRATENEIVRFVGRHGDYAVAYHGVDPEVFHPPSENEIETTAVALGLNTAPWIAFLGTIEPRKNIPNLIRAYASLVARWNEAWGEVPTLAIAGGAGWATELDADIAAVPAPGSVVRLGYIELESVHAYLGGAALVVYPSLGEGFGLPVLEAMSCGAAVLTTRRLALPEVGGDAVAYSEPDVEALAAALRRLIADPSERTRLADQGLERARRFTWRASAAVHEAAYEAAAARRR